MENTAITLTAADKERFWDKVNRQDQNSCWPWTACTVQGYGRIKIGGRKGLQVDAHRLSFEMAKGPIAAGMFVMHSCDNRLCVNPAHLSLGTVGDNNRDRDQKGRCSTKRGAQNLSAKLSEDQAREVLRLAAERVRPQREIADKFGVSVRTVQNIVAGVTWAHLLPLPTGGSGAVTSGV